MQVVQYNFALCAPEVGGLGKVGGCSPHQVVTESCRELRALLYHRLFIIAFILGCSVCLNLFSLLPAVFSLLRVWVFLSGCSVSRMLASLTVIKRYFFLLRKPSSSRSCVELSSQLVLTWSSLALTLYLSARAVRTWLCPWVMLYIYIVLTSSNFPPWTILPASCVFQPSSYCVPWVTPVGMAV